MEEIRRSALANKPMCDLEKVNLSLSALVSFSVKWGKVLESNSESAVRNEGGGV